MRRLLVSSLAVATACSPTSLEPTKDEPGRVLEGDSDDPADDDGGDPGGGADHDVGPGGWYGIDGSELAPHSQRIVELSTGGISASATGSDDAALAVDGLGRLVVAWTEYVSLE